jgi:hypothetical protein
MGYPEGGEGATGGWEPVVEEYEPMCEPYHGRDYVEVVVREVAEDGEVQHWTQAVPAWERDLYQREGMLVADKGDTAILERQEPVTRAMATERAAAGIRRDERARADEEGGRGR